LSPQKRKITTFIFVKSYYTLLTVGLLTLYSSTTQQTDTDRQTERERERETDGQTDKIRLTNTTNTKLRPKA